MYVNVFSSIKKNLYLNIQLRAQVSILKVVRNVYMWIFVVFSAKEKNGHCSTYVAFNLEIVVIYNL